MGHSFSARLRINKQTNQPCTLFALNDRKNNKRKSRFQDTVPAEDEKGGSLPLKESKQRRYLGEIKKMAPALGLEPRTKWLTATYSTIELRQSIT